MFFKNNKEKLLKAVEDNNQLMIDTLQELVRIPSITGEEGKAQKRVIEIMKSIGLNVETYEANKEEICKHPAYIEVPYPYQDRPNVIGKLKGKGKGRSIFIVGHIDVVPPNPVSSWKHDPWGGEIDGNRLYGRGSFDMKAGVVANLIAVKSIIDADIKLSGDLLIGSTIEEELGGGGGLLACLMNGYRADALMTTEPISKIAIAHPGILYFRVKVKGKTAHAARSHLGVNAIGKMLKIYHALENLDEERAQRLSFPLIEQDSGRSCNLNMGTLKAGDWVSTVAGFADMECRMSFVIGETEEQAKAEVEKVIADVAKNDEWLSENPPKVEWFGWHTDPWLQDDKHEFVQTVKTVADEVLERPVELVGKPGGLDIRFAKYFNIPSLSIGPQGGNIHGVDEYVELDSLLLNTKIVALSILKWSGSEK